MVKEVFPKAESAFKRFVRVLDLEKRVKEHRQRFGRNIEYYKLQLKKAGHEIRIGSEVMEIEEALSKASDPKDATIARTIINTRVNYNVLLRRYKNIDRLLDKYRACKRAIEALEEKR